MPIKNKRDRRAAKISSFAASIQTGYGHRSVTLTVDELAEVMCIAALKAKNMSEAYINEHLQTAATEYYPAAKAVYLHKNRG